MGWLFAIVSMILCLYLWFRDVKRIMEERKSTVESASGQFCSCRKRVASARNDPEIKKVYERSREIYLQAVELYDLDLKKPRNYLPALLMGFRPIQAESDGY